MSDKTITEKKFLTQKKCKFSYRLKTHYCLNFLVLLCNVRNFSDFTYPWHWTACNKSRFYMIIISFSPGCQCWDAGFEPPRVFVAFVLEKSSWGRFFPPNTSVCQSLLFRQCLIITFYSSTSDNLQSEYLRASLIKTFRLPHWHS